MGLIYFVLKISVNVLKLIFINNIYFDMVKKDYLASMLHSQLVKLSRI